MSDREKLIELCEELETLPCCDTYQGQADYLIANGVTVQKWVSVAELPKENGYYLCVVCVSSVNERKEYRYMILYWEDNVWIDMPNCFRTRKPLCWMPLPELPKDGEA